VFYYIYTLFILSLFCSDKYTLSYRYPVAISIFYLITVYSDKYILSYRYSVAISIPNLPSFNDLREVGLYSASEEIDPFSELVYLIDSYKHRITVSHQRPPS